MTARGRFGAQDEGIYSPANRARIQSGELGVTTRRAVLAAIMAGGVGLPDRGAGAVLAQEGTPGASRSNVVVVQVDDLDAALFAAALPDLPVISSLVADGTVFNRYFVSTPLCSPSRASLLRGQYAHNTGVLWNRGEEGGSGGFEAFHRLGLEDSTLATWLRGAGYRTGLIGKYLNNYPMGAEPGFVPPGWDTWAVHASDSREAFYYDYELNQNGEIITYGSAEEDYSTDVIAALSEAFIRESAEAGAPFFLLATPYAPHDPAEYAPRHADRFNDRDPARAPSWNEEDVSDKPEWVRNLPVIDGETAARVDEGYRNRLRSMLAVDDLVATLLSALEDTAQRANTVFIFTSDNGFHFGEHRVKFGKVTPYDESTRVPLVMAGPGIASGASVDVLAVNADLAPTIASWTGVAAPDFVDGRSLAGIASGTTPDAWRNWVLLQQFEQIDERGRATPEPKRKPVKHKPLRGTPEAESVVAATPNAPERMIQADLPPFAALRGMDVLYVEYQSGEREYYDLAADPFALENMFDSLTQDRSDALAVALAEFATCTGDLCRTADLTAG